ncbi:MAG: tellurite resistance TerB C-terminal domain-containing protein [Janthinobacterium lividum]
MPTNPDGSVIDVTGLFLKLKQAIEKEMAAPPPAGPPPARPSNVVSFYNYEPPNLGSMYQKKLSLTPRQISWLNRFPLPANSFLEIEAGREATVRLYLAVLPALEQQFKAEGTTLPQEVKSLDSHAKSLRYYANNSWYYTPPKAGADTYLAIFRQCENAVRELFGHKRKMSSLFGGTLAELERDFQRLLGRRVLALLPTLLPQLPPLDTETELVLNGLNSSRWKAELARLAARQPPPTPADLEALLARNARSSQLSELYREAAKVLALQHREAALGYYLRHIRSVQALYRQPKPLAKATRQQLFPLPEQARQFQVIVDQMALHKHLPSALAKLAGFYEVKRKKIELDRASVDAARHQHAGTVELLNEYLRDEPEAPAAANKVTPPQATKPAKASPSKKTAKAAPKPAATAPEFAGNLGLHATQQALLRLFVAHGLALSQTQVEEFAQSHGVLRNQLLDGLNDACYELLDDVLVEETGEGYAIYAPYFQKLTEG